MMRTFLFLAAAKLVLGQNNSSGPLTTNQAQASFALNLTQIKNFTFAQPIRSTFTAVTNLTISTNRTLPSLPDAHDITLEPYGRPLTLSNNVTAANYSFEPVGGHGQCDAGTGCCPDPRYNYKDTTYPWRAIGRIITATTTCAGTLVGPRHVITASHCVDWTFDSNGDIGWMTFQPDFYDTTVFKDYHALHTFKAGGTEEGDPDSEEGAGSDYVVIVLDDTAGNSLGWMGWRSYDTSWNNQNVWAHVGYPDDVGGGNRPSFLGPFPIANAWSPGFLGNEPGQNIEMFACVSPGDSGGPVFGFWSDGPYIVGVMSGIGSLPPVLSSITEGERSGNWAAGGDQMLGLIDYVRAQYP